MTNEDLAQLVKNGSEEALSALWESNIKYYNRMVSKVSSDPLTREDLLQEAFIGMWEAAKAYDPEAGSSFVSFSRFFVYRAFSVYFSNSSGVKVPLNAMMHYKRYEADVSRLAARLGHAPTSEDIAMYIGASEPDQDEFKRIKKLLYPVSSETLVPGSDDVTIGETIADPRDYYEEADNKADQERLRPLLWGLVDELDDRRAAILRRHYKDGVSLKDIAGETGLNYSTVAELHKSSLRMMQRGRFKAMLKPFMESSLLFKGSLKAFKQSHTSIVEYAVLRAEESQDKECAAL